MPYVRFPSNFVYWFNIDPEKHDKIKQMLLPKIELEYSKNLKTSKDYFMSGSDAVTNFSENPSYMIDEFIAKTIVWDPLDEMIRSNNETDNYKIKLVDSRLESYWYTSYKAGDFFERHNHKGFPYIPPGQSRYYYPTFSLIYILHDDNQENSTMFVDTNPYTLSPFVETTIETSDYSDIKEGTVMIFPSHMIHSVKKIEKGKRITLAYNVVSTFS